MPTRSTADAVAGTLRSSRNLAGYRIEIKARDGLVTLDRHARRAPPRRPRPWLAPGYVAGVVGVVDQLQVTNDRSVRPVQYQPSSPAAAVPAAVSPELALGHHRPQL